MGEQVVVAIIIGESDQAVAEGSFRQLLRLQFQIRTKQLRGSVKTRAGPLDIYRGIGMKGVGVSHLRGGLVLEIAVQQSDASPHNDGALVALRGRVMS